MAPEQRYAALLRFNILSMFQWQIEKRRLQRCDFDVKSTFDGRDRNIPRQGIIGKTLSRAALEIARELIEDEDKRQARTRRLPPGVKVALKRTGGKAFELLADTLVKRGVTSEPMGRSRADELR